VTLIIYVTRSFHKFKIGGSREKTARENSKELNDLAHQSSPSARAAGTVSKSTFLRIWNWKGAMRVIGHVLSGNLRHHRSIDNVSSQF